MHRKILALAAIGLMIPLVLGFAPAPLASGLTVYILGQVPACPTKQDYPPLTGYPVTLDPAQIALDRTEPNDPDYALRQPLLRAVITVPLGRPALYSGRACDPNEPDPVRLRVQDGQVSVLDATGAVKPTLPVGGWYALQSEGLYRWSWTPAAIGITYHWIEARDVRPETNDARSTRGTIAVVAVPQNKPPVLCGGLP